MSWSWVTAGAWLCHTALGGGLLLLLVWGLMRRVRQPARQQRLGECGLLAALLLALLNLAPAWLVVSVPVHGRRPMPSAECVGQIAADGKPEPIPAVTQGETERFAEPASPPRPDGDQATSPPAPAAAPPGAGWLPVTLSSGLAWLGTAYVTVAGLLAARWLLGHLALWRLLRTAEPAPAAVEELFASVAGERRPRLLVSRRLRVPVSCGLTRPTVVLPATLCPDPAALRWVFRHELTHLERRDPWTCLLFCLGQVVYFYLPWFWWARRQVGLCQEYIADAAVARAEDAPEEYAGFLLRLTRAPAVPAGAAGLAGRPSDLFRRITMLLQAPLPVEKRCPPGWSVAAALGPAVLAVVASGVGVEAVAAPVLPEAAAAPSPPVPDTVAPARADQPRVDEARPPLPRPEASALDSVPAEPPPSTLTPTPVLPEPVPMARARSDRSPPTAPPHAWPEGGRLGVRVVPPDATLIDQLDLPPGQGLVVQEVLADSAAARAGLRAHDVLLALDDRPVPGDPWRFARLVEGARGGVALSAVVVRRGQRQTLPGLVLPDGSPGPGPFPWPFGGPGRRPASPPGAMVIPDDDGAVTSIFRTGDRFAARRQERGLAIEIRGSLTRAGWHVEGIAVQAGGAVVRYTRLDQVPAAYRGKVAALLEASARSGVGQAVPPT